MSHRVEPSAPRAGAGHPAINGFAEAVVLAIGQPLIVLDANLVVQMVNPAFLETFRVSENETRSRALKDLGNGQWHIPELQLLLRGLLDEQGVVDDYRVEHEFDGIGRRVMVLNGRRIVEPGHDELILLAITDKTEEERARWETGAALEFAEKTIDAVRDPLLVLDDHLCVMSGNEPFYERFHTSPEETQGRPVYQIGEGRWNNTELRRLLEDILPKEDSFDDFELDVEVKGAGRRVMMLNARRIDHMQRILLAIEDITDRRRSETRQKAVMGELQHRVKNILMNVRALARLTKDRSRTLDEYFQNFDGRVAALGRTQDLLVRSRNDMVPLDGLLRLELESSGGREGETFTLAGPPVELRASAAQAIAMAIHELATNAAKHGALRRAGGAIAVDWHNEDHDSRRHMRLRWRETGVHDMASPDAKSFGMQIIERMVPYSLGGTSLVTFHPDGVECTIVFPLTDS